VAVLTIDRPDKANSVIAERPAAAVNASVTLARQVARGDETEAWQMNDDLAAKVAAAVAVDRKMAGSR
jgi:hypothetical protein